MNKGVRVINFLLSTLVATGIAVAVAYLNFLLIRFHFQGDFNQNIASIEISYIQMAKFWVEGGGAGWQPLWYLGYPWHVFYTPVLPALEVALHNFFDFSFAHAYRFITGIGYILVPISTFLFVWQISKSKSGAAIAALIYTLVPSLIALLFKEVAADTISGVLEPRRYTILIRWGEGPHTLALVFIPIFGVFLSRYLEQRKFFDMLLAAIFLGLAAMTNAIALWASMLLLVAFVLGKIAEGRPLRDFSGRGGNVILGNSASQNDSRREVLQAKSDSGQARMTDENMGDKNEEITKWIDSTDIVSILKRVFGILILCLGLISFWYNFQFISTFFREGGSAFSNWAAMFPWGVLVFLLGAVLVFIFIKKFFGRVGGLPFAIFWFLMIFGIVYVYYASGDSKLEYVPQALRLNTEADLTLSVLIGVAISRVFLFLVQMKGYQKFIGWVSAAVVLIVPLIPLAILANKMLAVLPQNTKPVEASKISNIENTAEYRMSLRVKELIGDTDQRVFAPGNYGFWLNFFEDVPQIRGALYQSSTHFWPEHIYYQVTNGSDGNISLAWLKIANIGKLVYTTIGSTETYKDYKAPQEKFDKVLKQISTESGDVYFTVPLKNDSLAKIVEANGLEHLGKPFNAIDDEPIYEYVDWIEKYSDRRIEVTQLKRDRLRISGEVNSGEAVLVQSTYDSGWTVKTAKGQGSWKVEKDPFDFMVLVPQNPGSFQLDLVYRRPLAVYFGYLVTFITIVYIAKRGFMPGLSFKNPLKRQ